MTDLRRSKARLLREQGMTYEAIGVALGIGIGTAHRWLNSESAERSRLKSKEAKRRRQARLCQRCGGKLAYDRQLNRLESALAAAIGAQLRFEFFPPGGCAISPPRDIEGQVRPQADAGPRSKQHRTSPT